MVSHFFFSVFVPGDALSSGSELEVERTNPVATQQMKPDLDCTRSPDDDEAIVNVFGPQRGM